MANNIYLFIIWRGCKLAVNLQCSGVSERSLFSARAHDLNSSRLGPLEIEAKLGFVAEEI